MLYVKYLLAFLFGMMLFEFLWRLFRGGRRRSSSIGTYTQIKRMIRSGTAKPLDIGGDQPPVESLEEIYAHEDAVDFGIALSGRLASRWLDGETLNETETLVYAVDQLADEVSNGGFDQYFFNSASDFAVEALAGLRAIDEVRLAKILESAMAIVGGGDPALLREDRWEQLEELGEEEKDRLSDLDSEWFGADEGLFESTMRYCRAKRTEFT